MFKIVMNMPESEWNQIVKALNLQGSDKWSQVESLKALLYEEAELPKPLTSYERKMAKRKEQRARESAMKAQEAKREYEEYKRKLASKNGEPQPSTNQPVQQSPLPRI